MAAITLPNIEGYRLMNSSGSVASPPPPPLLFQTAILAIGWSELHSEIVCEKGKSSGKDYSSVPVVTAEKRHVVE